MQPKRERRKQLRTLTCPNCDQKGSLKTILWGMPEKGFNYDKYASGGCVIPSASPPDFRCSECGYEGYRDFMRLTDDDPMRLTDDDLPN